MKKTDAVNNNIKDINGVEIKRGNIVAVRWKETGLVGYKDNKLVLIKNPFRKTFAPDIILSKNNINKLRIRVIGDISDNLRLLH